MASLSPGPVDICLETTATVAGNCVAVAAGPDDFPVQIEGGSYVLFELIVKHFVFCTLFR